MTDAMFNAIMLFVPVILVFAIMLIINFINIKSKERRERYKEIVRETSIRCKQLSAINEDFHFNSDSLSSTYVFNKTVNNKRQFDRFDFDRFFEDKIEELDYAFIVIDSQVKENQTLFNKYNLRLQSISKPFSEDEIKALGVPFETYLHYENELFDEILLKPVISTEFVFNVFYTSPQGMNKYHDQKTYTLDDLQIHYLKVKDRKAKKESKEYQRKIMTDSLRYDIMKRDGFKCVLCGRNAKDDGVKLHVDHIIPVSKGGKTEPDNLRTLCESCNFGKRDKYDEEGTN